MACQMWFGFQFNLSDSSDDDLFRLDLDADANANHSKTICRSPLKGVDIILSAEKGNDHDHL